MKTVEELSVIMRNLEKIIQHFNRKYNYDMSKAPELEQRAYESILQRWDDLKAKRNRLQALQN